MIKKVEMHISEHVLDEDDGPGEQSINANLFVQGIGATPAEKAKSGANWAAKNLGLTDEQKPKWEAAALERITANTAIREKLKGSTTPEERKALRGEMKGNHEKFDNTVTAFLTDEQKAKWAKEKEDRKNKMKAKAKGKKGEVEEDIED